MISGRNQVEIRSRSGPNQVRAEGFSWVGARGVGPGGRVPVAPRKVSTLSSSRSSGSRESPQTCDSLFLVPRNAIRKKRVQFGNLRRFARILPTKGGEKRHKSTQIRETLLSLAFQ